MKIRKFVLLFLLPLFLSCSSRRLSPVVQLDVAFAAEQTERLLAEMELSGKILSPRTFEGGKNRYTSFQDWTSGFFPGTLWHLYELTGDKGWRERAVRYTEALEKIQHLSWHHDIGFMMGSSYGNGWRLTGNEAYEPILIQSARSLVTRFRPAAGIIQSWNVTGGWQAQRGWKCPVIIDNMMNLELLFLATRLSGDSSFYKIAVSHADRTMQHHYRPDYSCYHVVDYDPQTGDVRYKQTAQGYAHESAWSRGQAWGLYGFTLCYRFTGDRRYLIQAEQIAGWLMTHRRLPDDGVPYWDFDDPKIPDAPRDASAAAVIASALYELSGYSDRGKKYIRLADRIVRSLSSPAYRAAPGANGNFILMHSVGSIPHGAEIDAPLVYADYYFLEALKRRRELSQ